MPAVPVRAPRTQPTYIMIWGFNVIRLEAADVHIFIHFGSNSRMKLDLGTFGTFLIQDFLTPNSPSQHYGFYFDRVS